MQPLHSRGAGVLSRPAACAVALLSTLCVSPLCAQQIRVGPGVQVSRDRPQQEHGEAVICAHLSNPDLLIAAAASATHAKPIYAHGETSGEIAYYSTDGGASWHYALDTFSAGAISPDAACAYGPDGSAHFSTMVAAQYTPDNIDLDLRLLDYRSPDGGRTWDKPVQLPGASGADRQFMIFDNTGGRYQGRYYMSFDGSFNQRTIENERVTGVFGLSRSLDGGRTWDLPAVRATSNAFHNGNLVVLSDGTVVCVLGTAVKPPVNPDPTRRYPTANVHVITSSDGGEFVSRATVVSDMYYLPTAGVHRINAIAVDGSAAYRDRLYVAWNDDRSGRMRILLSYSTDKGHTWSVPRAVDDDVAFDAHDLSKGPQASAPWLVVNREGIVGLVWLDRRDMTDNAGYRMRFTASLDGGETWLPSVPVMEQPMLPRAVWSVAPRRYNERPNPDTLSLALGWDFWDFTGGDMTAIDVDAAGGFHPVWVDARTGVRQIWTTTIHVSGPVIAQKQITKEPVSPVTRVLALEYLPDSYAWDASSGSISVDARLRNTGKETLTGPLIARVTTLATRVADDVSVSNSDNGQTSRGAEWDFTTLMPGGKLEPGQATGVKTLRFTLLGARTFVPARMTATGFVILSLEVLGKGAVTPPKKTGSRP